MIELSNRELDVLKLTAQGRSTIESAKTLNITKHTICDHRNAILRKLDADNMIAAVTKAHRLRIINLDDVFSLNLLRGAKL